jgi:hypothetical protein
MMQAADLREGNNIALAGKLHATRPWAVLVERETRSGVDHTAVALAPAAWFRDGLLAQMLTAAAESGRKRP